MSLQFKHSIWVFILAMLSINVPSCLAQVQVAPFLSPSQQFFDNNGNPLAGGKVCTFSAGTLTPLASYSDLGVTLNSNPIILDSAGRGNIYLTTASYKIVTAASTANSQCSPAISSADNVSWNNLAQSLTSLTVTGPSKIVSGSAATSGANQSSPLDSDCGNYWTGTISAQDCWSWSNVLGSGANPTSTLTLTHSGSSGATALNFAPPLTFNTINVSGVGTFGSVVNNGNEVLSSTSVICWNADSGITRTAAKAFKMGDCAGSSDGTLALGTLTAATVNSSGGALNGSLGATTPSTVNATTGVFSGSVTAPNVAGKNSSSDHTIYLSSAGNDSNDGLDWGHAKLTAQAAFNAATTSGANPGNVVAACGTYAGPTTWYSNLLFWGWGSSDSTGNNFGVLPGTGTPCVKVTYSSTETLTGLQNIFVRNVYFDFANSGAGFVLNSVVSSHFDDNTFNQCGNASTPCVLMKTIGTGGPGQNTMLNVFRGTHIIANNSGSGANATGFKLLGQGSVNCVGACGAVTLNQFYNTVCAGGVLHCIDFELNTDTNRFYDVNCNQDVPLSGSSCVSFNELVPASDQDANGEVVFNMCVTGTFSAQIRAGQSNGNDITACIGGNGLPSITILGGTPNADIHTVGLDGVLKATQYSGVLGVAASLALSPPSGAVAGDGYVARTSTTGNQFFGTDNAQLLRSGNLWEFISGVTTVIPAVATADIGLVPITGTPVHLTSQTTATSNTVGIVGTNIAAGVYEFHATCSTTTSGTGTTGTMNLIWTDSGGTRTSPTNWALNSVTITGVALAGALPIRVTSGSVTFSTTGTFGTSVYACDAWLTREN